MVEKYLTAKDNEIQMVLKLFSGSPEAQLDAVFRAAVANYEKWLQEQCREPCGECVDRPLQLGQEDRCLEGEKESCPRYREWRGYALGLEEGKRLKDSQLRDWLVNDGEKWHEWLSGQGYQR